MKDKDVVPQISCASLPVGSLSDRSPIQKN